MSDTSAASGSASTEAKKRGGLSTMLVADLRALAAGMGVAGAETMKKPQLVAAIRTGQSAGARSGAAAEPTGRAEPAPATQAQPAQQGEPAEPAEPAVRTTRTTRSARSRRGQGAAETAPTEAPSTPDAAAPAAAAGPEPTPEPTPEQPAGRSSEQPAGEQDQPTRSRARSRQRGEDQQASGDEPVRQDPSQGGQDQTRDKQGQDRSPDKQSQDRSADQARDKQGQGNQGQSNQNNQGGPNQDQQSDGEGEGEGRRNRRRRGRDRNRAEAGAQQGQGGQDQPRQDKQGQGNQGNQGNQGGQGQGNQDKQQSGQRHQREPDTTILDDDVLVPAAGILDVLDNYAFVRTSGYLPGADDVYVSLSMVRRYGLRRGDALMGQVRQPREGERKEKFNPMVRIDLVNGADPESAKQRPELTTLTALHPTERLRLESGPGDVVGRVVDLVTPLGKGQRALVVSPAGAGKTTTLAAVAASVSANHPECHLMVVLVDQRPEEVTELQRSVKGEVIASTFDRPAADHTLVAELAVERAKRLVELGHDVVLLLDGLTRLGRAYVTTTAPTGRGGAAATPGEGSALHPVKRFFGAARDVEDGGSLTILATAQVDSGSGADDVLLEELEGAANCVLRLRREAADQSLFPAVDVLASRTAHTDRLLGEEEAAIVVRLRRLLAEAPGHEQALQLLLDRLAKASTNIELLTRVQRG